MERQIDQISETIDGITLLFHTHEKVFSPMSVDKGTKCMLKHINPSENDKVLDLGCGYGVVGIYLAKKLSASQIVMCDVLERACELSRQNCVLNEVPDIMVLQSDGLSGIEAKDFNLILSNPPYHTDFSVAKGFIEEGFRHLVVGGRMFMVTKRLDWYKNKLTSVFGGVKVCEEGGYYVFEAEKRPRKQNKDLAGSAGKPKVQGMSKKLARRYHKDTKQGK